jgi:hypothetical protein
MTIHRTRHLMDRQLCDISSIDPGEVDWLDQFAQLLSPGGFSDFLFDLEKVISLHYRLLPSPPRQALAP